MEFNIFCAIAGDGAKFRVYEFFLVMLVLALLGNSIL